jgi:hypothetical protein
MVCRIFRQLPWAICEVMPTIGRSGMFIWRIFGFLPYSVIGKMMLDLIVGIKLFQMLFTTCLRQCLV